MALARADNADRPACSTPPVAEFGFAPGQALQIPHSAIGSAWMYVRPDAAQCHGWVSAVTGLRHVSSIFVRHIAHYFNADVSAATLASWLFVGDHVLILLSGFVKD
jgi:hypothetical protein